MTQEVLMASHRHLRAHLARHHGHIARPNFNLLDPIGDALRGIRFGPKTERLAKKANDLQNEAENAGIDYETCYLKKLDDQGKSRNDVYPCSDKKGRLLAFDKRMHKKGKPGKCDKKGLTANCHEKWEKYIKKFDKAAAAAEDARKSAEDDGYVYGGQIIDEILYEANPKAFQDMQAAQYEAYVAKTGLEPPSPRDYQESYTADNPPAEDESGSIMPILLGVAGLGALGFLGYSLFSE
jgi:hypothetical protein